MFYSLHCILKHAMKTNQLFQIEVSHETICSRMKYGVRCWFLTKSCAYKNVNCELNASLNLSHDFFHDTSWFLCEINEDFFTEIIYNLFLQWTFSFTLIKYYFKDNNNMQLIWYRKKKNWTMLKKNIQKRNKMVDAKEPTTLMKFSLKNIINFIFLFFNIV